MASYSEILKKHISIITILLIIAGSTSFSEVYAGNIIKGAFVSGIYKKLKDKDYDNAIKKCRKLRKKHLYKDYSYFLEGMAYYLKKDHQMASEMFKEAIAINDKRGDAYFYKASSNYILKKFNEALSDINKAINNTKTPKLLGRVNKEIGYPSSEAANKSNLFWLRSKIYYGKKQLDKALEDINHSLVIAPYPYPTSYFHRGNIYFNYKKYNLAYKDFEKTVKLDSKEVKAWNMMGVIDFYNGNYKRDVENSKKALKLDPSNISLLGNISLGYWMMGKQDEAMDLLKKVSQKAKEPISYFHLGYYHHVKGNQELALENFNKAKELYPKILTLRKSYINKTPISSPTRQFYQEEYDTAKIYLETGQTPDVIAYENKPSVIKIENLSANPNPAKVNKPFDIIVSFKTDIAVSSKEIPVFFNFSISQNNIILFESEPIKIKADNGIITHWKTNMNPVPLKGAYTIKGYIKYKKTIAEKIITLTIK